MRKKDVQQKIERTGFCFTDVETPAGTMRISASGPKFPSTEGREGERPTVVRVTGPDGRTIERSAHTNQAAGARKYVRLVEDYSEQ